MGLVKAGQRKCKAFRLWPLKKSLTLAQCCEMDDICLVKMSWMCDEYCITVNELYLSLEWFIIEKMLIKKKKQEPWQRSRQTFRYTYVQGIALEMNTWLNHQRGRGGTPKLSPALSPMCPISNAKPSSYRRRCYGTMVREQPLSRRCLWRDCWVMSFGGEKKNKTKKNAHKNTRLSVYHVATRNHPPKQKHMLIRENVSRKSPRTDLDLQEQRKHSVFQCLCCRRTA